MTRSIWIKFALVGALASTAIGGLAVARADGLSTDGSLPGAEVNDQCRRQYLSLRKDVEQRAEPIRDLAKHPLAQEELCKVFDDYEGAMLKIIGYLTANAKRCGFAAKLSDSLIATYSSTVTLREKACPMAPQRFG